MKTKKEFPAPDIFPEPDKYLDHGDALKVKRHKIYVAGPLSPCIGIAVLNKRTHEGFLGYDYITSIEIIQRVLGMAEKKYSDETYLDIVITGNGKDSVDLCTTNEELNESDGYSEHIWKSIDNFINTHKLKPYITLLKPEHRGRIQMLYLDCKQPGIYVKEETYTLNDLLNDQLI